MYNKIQSAEYHSVDTGMKKSDHPVTNPVARSGFRTNGQLASEDSKLVRIDDMPPKALVSIHINKDVSDSDNGGDAGVKTNVRVKAADAEPEISEAFNRKQIPKYYKEDSREDPLNLYFEDLDSIKLLTRREEVDLAKKIERARRRFSQNLSRLPMCTEILLAEYERVRSGEIPITDVIEWLAEGGSESDRSADIIGLADNVCQFPTATESNSDSGPSALDEGISAELLNMIAIDRHMRSLAGLYEKFTLAASRHSYGHGVCKDYRSAISTAFMQFTLSEKILSKMLKAVKHLSETINSINIYPRRRWSKSTVQFENSDMPAAEDSASCLPKKQGTSIGNSRQRNGCATKNIETSRSIETENGLGVEEIERIIGSITKAEKQTEAAIGKLVEGNLRLVVFFAKRYNQGFMALSDLIQEGNIGVMRAAQKFDYRRGQKFSTYAAYWIRLAISRAIASQSRTIRLPFRVVDKINDINRVKNDFKKEKGRDPTVNEITEYINLSETVINKLETFSRLPLSLDVTPGFDEDLPNLTHLVEQTVYPSPFDDTAHEDLGRVMKNAINVLTQFESKIVCCRYGIGTNTEVTLQDLGNEHNLSRERIRQIQAQALNKLRKQLGGSLRDYID